MDLLKKYREQKNSSKDEVKALWVKFVNVRTLYTNGNILYPIYNNTDEAYIMFTNANLNEAIPIRLTISKNGDSTPFVDKWIMDEWVEGFPIINFTDFMLSHIKESRFSINTWENNKCNQIIENGNLLETISDKSDLLRRIELRESRGEDKSHKDELRYFQEWFGDKVLLNGYIDKATGKGMCRIFKEIEIFEVDTSDDNAISHFVNMCVK